MKSNQNYQKVLQNTINSLDHKPKLLLHACCGPCFTIPYEILKDHFQITIFYNNSNIYPKTEHDRRLEELKHYISENKFDIKVIETTYNNEEFNKDLLPYADLPEGHERCRVCFRKRFEEGFKYASENGYEYFGSVMSISRYKSAKDLNEIGEKMMEKYPNVKWLYADFKKNDGYEKSLVIIQNSGMYFQHYCGCKFSYQKYQEKN